MAALFADGSVAALLLGFVLVEAALLVAWHRRTGHGLPPAEVTSLLLPGACLMLALWAALAGAWWGWIGLALAASLATHLLDLRRRWSAQSGRRPGR
jgi:hypothetical protein